MNATAQIAQTFAESARRAGVTRIVYLGGLGDPAEIRSNHLTSRQEVGRILAARGVPVIEFRAAVIVGSGSVSFEMIRYLTERLPVMITPGWVDTRCQPIGVRNVIDYLLETLERPDAEGIYEIGGPDVLTYRQMMVGYARSGGSAVGFSPSPCRTPNGAAGSSTSSRRFRTPWRSRSWRACSRDGGARRPRRPRVQRAADGLSRGGGARATRVASDEVETTWASSLASFSGDQAQGRQLAVHEGMLFERHRIRCSASPEAVFDVICALGGDGGWPAGNALWQLRGLVDRVFGGVGMRRGRRHPRQLRIGEPVDFWRVEALEPPHLVRLRAEMKLPGTAWLQFEVLPDGDGARIEQTAFFDPHGLPGYLYWYAVLPFHRFVFPGLIRAVRERAETGIVELSAA